MTVDCFAKNCLLRTNETSNPYACYCQSCMSRVTDCSMVKNVDALNTPPFAQYEDCLGCQHFPVCRDAEQKISPCEHRLPHLTIDENKMRRVYQQVEDHGGIHHLIGLDQLAWEGRLLILPNDEEKRKQIWNAIKGLDLGEGGI